ncbi:MAG: exosome complex protein Rrp42 [Candidatus Pacearchaeota archaeon]
MEISNITKRAIAELLKQDKRLDGRNPLDYRDIVVETNISKNAEGTARVRIGKTEVIVGVKMDTQEPYPDHEDEGTMMTSMEFSPICGSRYESGPPKMNAIETARVVDRGVRESGFINWKKLCIKEGEKVWSISIDIYCINDDGNVLDASAIGAVTALKLTRLPVYDEKEGKVKYGEFTDEKLPLTDNVPFTMTFFKIGNKIIIDPNREEEDTASARVTFAVSKGKKEHMINAMQKGEMDSVSADELIEMVNSAEKVYDELFPKIEKKIKSLEK